MYDVLDVTRVEVFNAAFYDWRQAPDSYSGYDQIHFYDEPVFFKGHLIPMDRYIPGEESLLTP